jgi:hypothetical protein
VASSAKPDRRRDTLPEDFGPATVIIMGRTRVSAKSSAAHPMAVSMLGVDAPERAGGSPVPRLRGDRPRRTGVIRASVETRAPTTRGLRINTLRIGAIVLDVSGAFLARRGRPRRICPPRQP